MKIYSVKLTNCPEYEVHMWLKENIGPGVYEEINAWENPDIKWSTWSSVTISKTVEKSSFFEFKNEKDAMLFILKWK